MHPPKSKRRAIINLNTQNKKMKSITIKGSQRESVGKVATKALRNAGQVPCVVYGGDKAIHFSAETLAFNKFSIHSRCTHSSNCS